MPVTGKSTTRYILIPSFLIAAVMALVNLDAGAPQVNIDDYSLYEGGFLVWFGHAPPQHAYLECWINGATSLATFVVKSTLDGRFDDVASLEIVSNAYSDFYYHPDIYYSAYRFVLVVFYLATAFIVFLIAKRCIAQRLSGFGPALAAVLYLFSFNTFWCNLAGRPDTLVAFFGMLGFLFHLKSNYRSDSPWFWLSAMTLGVTAGLKLHGAFFAIFAALDVLRVRGIRQGLRGVLVLTTLSVAFFMIADGTLLFDPLKYVKARVATFHDDISLYLVWGQQFPAMLRGSGWLSAPLAMMAWFAIRGESRNARVRSVVFFALCWLVLFASIRQLRAYWMLPALPLIYISAVVVMDRMKQAGYALAVAGVIVVVAQSMHEVALIHSSPYGELRSWVEQNVARDDWVLLVGYNALRIPMSDAANSSLEDFLKKTVIADRHEYRFTYRHLKHWEELSKLRLLDMLVAEHGAGLNLVRYLEYGNVRLDWRFMDKFDCIIVQEGFHPQNEDDFVNYLKRYFELIDERVGEGGQGYGLNYLIYRRREPN